MRLCLSLIYLEYIHAYGISVNSHSCEFLKSEFKLNLFISFFVADGEYN